MTTTSNDAKGTAYKLFLIGALLLLNFTLVLAIGFAISANSFQREIETIEVQVTLLEKSLSETSSKIERAVVETNDMINEIFESLENVATVSQTSLNIPPLDTSFKGYMDYRTITCRTSAQYALQQKAYTDELGLRKIGEFYCVALGTYYTPECGAKFKIVTDEGNEFCAIVADIKADCHTDSKNMYVPLPDGSANVVEFIVDTPAMERRVVLLGDISGYEQFSGNIVKIERI